MLCKWACIFLCVGRQYILIYEQSFNRRFCKATSCDLSAPLFAVFDVCRSNDSWSLKAILFLSATCTRQLHKHHTECDLFIRNDQPSSKLAYCGTADSSKCFMVAAINHLAGQEMVWSRGCSSGIVRCNFTQVTGWLETDMPVLISCLRVWQEDSRDIIKLEPHWKL